LWSAASLGLAAIAGLSKDYEYQVQTSESMIDIAATRLMLNRARVRLNFSNTL
jgi:hypothetical protein